MRARGHGVEAGGFRRRCYGGAHGGGPTGCSLIGGVGGPDQGDYSRPRGSARGNSENSPRGDRGPGRNSEKSLGAPAGVEMIVTVIGFTVVDVLGGELVSRRDPRRPSRKLSASALTSHPQPTKGLLLSGAPRPTALMASPTSLSPAIGRRNTPLLKPVLHRDLRLAVSCGPLWARPAGNGGAESLVWCGLQCNRIPAARNRASSLQSKRGGSPPGLAARRPP